VSLVHSKERIDPRPKYQRDAVWKRHQQQLLIDSMLRGYDVPKIYLRELPGNKQYSFETIDGQQRLRAIWEFFNNEYRLNADFSPEQGAVLYSELDMETKRRLDHYSITVVIVRDAAEIETREMFCRLQNGTPLNSAEKRNAMLSKMRDFCDSLAEHKFFLNSVAFSNKRMEHQHVAAQTVTLELRGGPATCSAPSLGKLYKEYANFSHTSENATRVKKVYNFLARAFPEKTPELRRGMVVSSYLLLSCFMKQFSMQSRESDFRNFILDFEHRRRTRSVDDSEMNLFTSLMSRTSDTEDAIRKRHEILERECHLFISDLVPLDPKRGFNESQRIFIFRRDRERCKLCGKPVKWADSNADHIVAYVSGGATTVENGQLACASCNKAKQAK
jgi:hypothetical protein